MEEKSEFGKGLVLCLCKFAEHFPALDYYIKMWARLREKNPHLFSESDAIQIWANGAADHLYDIETPNRWSDNPVFYEVDFIKKLGLEMGHGFTGKKWELRHVQCLQKMTNICVRRIGFPARWLLKLSVLFSIHNFDLEKKRMEIDWKEKMKRRFCWVMTKIIRRFAWFYDIILGLKPDIGEW